MICPRCGHKNVEGRTTCSLCHTPLQGQLHNHRPSQTSLNRPSQKQTQAAPQKSRPDFKHKNASFNQTGQSLSNSKERLPEANSQQDLPTHRSRPSMYSTSATYGSQPSLPQSTQVQEGFSSDHHSQPNLSADDLLSLESQPAEKVENPTLIRPSAYMSEVRNIAAASAARIIASETGSHETLPSTEPTLDEAPSIVVNTQESFTHLPSVNRAKRPSAQYETIPSESQYKTEPSEPQYHKTTPSQPQITRESYASHNALGRATQGSFSSQTALPQTTSRSLPRLETLSSERDEQKTELSLGLTAPTEKRSISNQFASGQPSAYQAKGLSHSKRGSIPVPRLKKDFRFANRIQLPALWRRAVAGILDISILIAVGFVLTLLLGPSLKSSFPTGLQGLDLLATILQRYTSQFSFFLLVFSVSYIAYSTFFLSRDGQTVGKKLVGLRVVERNGMPLSILSCLSRSFAFLIFFFLVLSGISWILVDKEYRGLHDRVSNTIVIRAT